MLIRFGYVLVETRSVSILRVDYFQSILVTSPSPVT